ncbi:MAG: MerR family transcriptional regulator [Gammaproteobacteria bacterium]
MQIIQTNDTATLHPIQVVARRTGLSKDVIRAWEKRYQVVEPQRHTNGRRLYSDQDIQRLSLLHKVTLSGRRISDISTLDHQALEALLNGDLVQTTSIHIKNTEQDYTREKYLEPLIDSIIQMDEDGIFQSLVNASTALPQIVFLEEVLAKALEYMGDSWNKGNLRIAHEHLASIQIKRFLLNLLHREVHAGPALLVTTPVGQRHELGALMAAIIAAMQGWRVRFMGAEMPATDIAAAVLSTESKGILLSLVSRADEKFLEQEINTLSSALADDIFVIVGGGQAQRYAPFFSSMNATHICGDLRSLSSTLEEL